MIKNIQISKIETIDALSVQGLHIVSNSSCVLPKNVNFANINIYGKALVKIEDALDNNQKIYTTTISYSTSEKKMETWRRPILRLTSVDGTRFLVGINKRPYPIVTESNPYPSKETESPMKTVTITWKSVYPMLYIVE